MYAIYLRKTTDEDYHFKGRVFYEMKQGISVNDERKRHSWVVRPFVFIYDFFRDRVFQKSYQLVIKNINYSVPNSTSVKLASQQLESHIKEMFAECRKELGFLTVTQTPKERIKHKKANSAEKLEKKLANAIQGYRRKGFNIPDSIPEQVYTCERREKTTLGDILFPPYPEARD